MAASRRSHTSLEGHPESCIAPLYSVKTGTFQIFQTASAKMRQSFQQ